ncbi:adenylate kinase [Haloglomus irregulare]|jgi:adenylate kinase|uniref:Adenylate kinase n=1 Tax=Haloglomus irregulare TaxID=2234134 RepID=A0A554NAJ8_9EURY|nr:adenylate kinase [Haloglomus irregulare]TSD14000.1 adenylate kinase [Haloglomus irregulare]
MGVTVLAGVPGVGLTALAERARKQLSDEYELVNFGDVMLEQAVANDLVETRGDLAGLPRETTRRLQRRAGEYVADRSDAAEVLLTTHLVVETDVGLLPGLPDAVLRDVDPDLLVVVETTPETVRERRTESPRGYEDETALAIEFEQDFNRTAAFEYAVAADAPVRLVENEADVAAGAEALAAAVSDRAED